jgi:hypothetical protein
MTKPGPSQSSPDHHHPALRHPATRGDEKDAYSFNLVEGADYVLEEGKSVVLTQAGLERMVEAHTAGRDVIIEVAGVVIFRLPAWWGD